jgi:hypothetical protein
MIRVIVLIFIWLFAVVSSVLAQSGTSLFEKSSRPVFGGTSGVPAPTEAPIINASRGNEILRHRDFTGKPCLTVSGSARGHTINPNLYDHIIVALNSCPQRIAMQACYYDTQDCIRMEIPGGERKEAILGTLPSIKSFRFEFRERF